MDSDSESVVVVSVGSEVVGSEVVGSAVVVLLVSESLVSESVDSDVCVVGAEVVDVADVDASLVPAVVSSLVEPAVSLELAVSEAFPRPSSAKQPTDKNNHADRNGQRIQPMSSVCRRTGVGS